MAGWHTKSAFKPKKAATQPQQAAPWMCLDALTRRQAGMIGFITLQQSAPSQMTLTRTYT